MMLLILVAVCAGASAQVWTWLRTVSSGYKLSEVTAENARLQEFNRQLKIELALLKNPARIKAWAKQKYGMAPPRPNQVRRLIDRSKRLATADQRLAGAHRPGARGQRNGT